MGLASELFFFKPFKLAYFLWDFCLVPHFADLGVLAKFRILITHFCVHFGSRCLPKTILRILHFKRVLIKSLRDLQRSLFLSR